MGTWGRREVGLRVVIVGPPSSGLSAPVPRGRKGKKAKKENRNLQLEENLERLSEEMEKIVNDDGYKKHLKRHANKYAPSSPISANLRLADYIPGETLLL